MGLNEGHIITYGKDEIETWPDWYDAAFGGKGMEPENITEGQRMMSSDSLAGALMRNAVPAGIWVLPRGVSGGRSHVRLRRISRPNARETH